MKNLSELAAVLAAIPTTFASAGTKTAPQMSTGLSSSYAGSGASALPRGEMNGIGELATRELFFRRVGGRRSFDANVSLAQGGYPKDSLLVYDDGTCVKYVASNKADNTGNFKSNPLLIDNLVTGEVLWRSASFVGGLSAGSLRVTVDFSRPASIYPVGTLAEDSLVVIGAMHYENVATGQSGRTLLTFTGNVSANGTLVLDMTNKGVCGLAGSTTTVDDTPWIYPDPLAGCANYSIAFFAKKNTTVSFSAVAAPVSEDNNGEGSLSAGESNGVLSSSGTPVGFPRSMFAFPIVSVSIKEAP